MHIELLLLILESVLLIVTVVLLIMTIREGRGRNALIMEVSRATRMLTRHEYFMMVMNTMIDAEKEVLGCITGRRPVGEDIKHTKEVVLNIEKLVSSGVTLRYLLPKFQDRLYLAWLYTKAGATVRFSGCPLVYDFRYIVVDSKVTVLGVPEAFGEGEATKRGIDIPSEGLAKILAGDFQVCWQESIRYEDYLKETIGDTEATVQTLSRELGIEAGELKKVLKK